MPQLADPLGHGAHRAIDTPGARLEQHHRDKAQHGRGQHHAVKAKGELGHARRDQRRGRRGKVPGQAEYPEQGHGLAQAGRPRRDQIGSKEHITEHEHEKCQEAIAEPLLLEEARHRPAPRQVQARAKQLE